jgi:hypothetical protein
MTDSSGLLGGDQSIRNNGAFTQRTLGRSDTVKRLRERLEVRRYRALILETAAP